MPPAQPPSSFPEPPDPLALLDQAVGDLIALAAPPSLAAAAGGGFGPLPSISGLPPIAGGAPGILDSFRDAWSWAAGSVVDPIADFLGGVVGSLAKAVLAVITGLLSVMGWWIYKWSDAALKVGTDLSWRSIFPHPDIVKGLSPWYYLHKTMRMLRESVVRWLDHAFDWLRNRVVDWAKWVRDRVSDYAHWVISYVVDWAKWVRDRVSDYAHWVISYVVDWAKWVRDRTSEMIGWLRDRVVDWAKWVRDRTSEMIGWLRDRVVEWAKWVWNQTSTAASWLRDRVVDWAKWVWAQVQDGLQWAWDNVISKIPEGVVAGAQEIGRLIREAFEWLVTSAFEPFVDVVNRKLAIPGKLLRAEYGSLEELIDDMLDPPQEMLKGWTGMMMMPFIVVGLLVNMVTGLSGPLLEPILQEQARTVGARIPPFAMLRDGLLRDLLPEGVHDDWLGRSGFEPANIALQKALYEEIPGPTDLVRMGVREVFTPEIAERFGQFEDLPPAFVEWMAKQGFTEEWARNFWGAHWDLPSVTQGFEMLHRDVVDDADLDLLLRALDVMPFWRDNLKEIAFRVITRVDVRRMYAEGVFDRDQVKRVYLDLGYKPEDAEALTEFVVRRYPRKGLESADDLRSLTTSSIKQAYARRLITGDDAQERLMELDYSADDAALIISIWEFDWFQDPSLRSDVDPKGLARSTVEKAYERRLIDLNAGVLELGELGYTPEDARLLLQLVDLRLDEQLADLEIDGLVSDYQDGIISDGQLAAALADLNIPQARIDFLLQREILQRQAKRRRLTLSQMKKALAADLMEEGEYRARLAATGYNTRDVDILVALNVEEV